MCDSCIRPAHPRCSGPEWRGVKATSPPGLLDSQLATLEPAGPGEAIHDLRIAEDVEALACTAIRLLGAR